MAKPTLTVIAGCNGSGKSSYSKALSSFGVTPFDYDQVFLNKYSELQDIDIRAEMAHNLARRELDKAVEDAIAYNTDFTYETNFNDQPLYWPAQFKKHNFNLRLVYFCLNSTIEAKRRVQIRVENGGHSVPEKEIERRYYDGFDNLNIHWKFFDVVHLFETSGYKKAPHFLLTLASKIKLNQSNDWPSYLSELIPEIHSISEGK